MPEITKDALSRYRLRRAEEMLASAQRELAAGDFASANNRAYYAIFHMMRAVLALDGEDYKKHSAVIARFTLNYLKTEILPSGVSGQKADQRSEQNFRMARRRTQAG